MRFKIFLSLITLLFPIISNLFAQEINIGYETGYGNYKMDGLRDFNARQLSTLPFEVKQFDNYPDYWYLKPEISFIDKSNSGFGFALNYSYTGSRMNREDYSGEYAFDTKINSWSYGFFFIIKKPISKITLNLKSEFGIQKSALSVNELIRIGEKDENHNLGFKSKNYYLEPAVNIDYPMGILWLSFNLGYHIDFYRENLKGNNNLTLNDSNLKPVGANWNGLRLGLSLHINLLKL